MYICELNGDQKALLTLSIHTFNKNKITLHLTSFKDTKGFHG